MKTTQQLLTATLKYCPREGTFDTPLPGLRIVRREKKTGATPGMYDPIVCLVLQGEKQVWTGKEVLRYNPDNYLVSCIDVPATFQVVKASKNEPYVGLTLQLQPSIVYRLLHEAPTAASGRQEMEGALFVEKVTPELRQAFLRLLATLESAADRKILAPAIIDEIHYRLMNSRFGAKIRQLGVAGSKTHRISKVLDHLRKDFAAPLKVASLAEMAHMSPSAFHLHFRHVTSMSPLQYQKQIRLQEARRLLSVEEMDATSVAFQVGYESPSQFSREYRRLFGQPPMRDVEKQRESVEA